MNDGPVDSRKHSSGFSQAQERALAALAEAGRACSGRELAGGGVLGPVVLTLRWLEANKLVSSKVVRISSHIRPEPVYSLTDKGRELYQRVTPVHVIGPRT